ncbi:MAG: DUF4190 domain-containing protein [Archangium sp.]|nr:DUF4190 domain-containing protein [Archangium sp.]
MKVFCPNCGTGNDGMPGGRLTCKACTASFEVPREGGVAPQPQVVSPPPVRPEPSRGVTGPPAANSPFPTGYVGPPPSGFGSGSGLASGQTNTLAIVSMVLGILCCVPFASLGAIITGVIAQNQINATNGQQKGKEFALVGIILGASSLLLTIASLIFNVLGRIR